MARKHTSAASLYQAQTRAFAKKKGNHKKLFDDIARAGLSDMHELTGGQTKTKTLVAEGHPYGRGGSAGSPGRGQRGNRRRRPPMPINQQTGRLRRGLYLKQASPGRYLIGSSAPHAKYQFSPFGTGKMIRRGVVGGRKLGGAMGEIERRFRARKKGMRMALKAQGF